MKKHKITKRFFAMAMCLCMIFTMMPMSAHATETEHTHEWHSSWSTDADGHWHICVAGDGCTEKGSYAAHDWNTNYAVPSCNTCYYYESHTHTGGTATCSDRATCELCGFLYGDTDPNNHKGGSYTPNDASTHKVSCQCGVTITESEAHGFLDWYDNGDGRETRYCMWCGYTEYRTIETHTHSYTAVVTAPTCEEQGYTTYTCECNDSYVDDYVNALGHDWGEWTFNGDGTHTRVCKTDSSHTENGNCDEIEWTYDSDCHSGRWLCDVCNGGVDKNSMDYPEHVYSNDTDLTCDTCGYTRSVEGSLSITGSMSDATVGEAYSASFGYTGTISGVVFWNATGLPDGLTINSSTGVVSGTPTTAGTYEVTISMGATGGGSASKDFTLTVNAPSHTHSYTTVVTAPTCNDQGYTTYTCSCGYSYEDDYVNALGHDWTDWKSNGNGMHSKTCQNGCGGHHLTDCHDADEDGYCNDCGTEFHKHVYAPATCAAPMTCSCGRTTGIKDPANHVGETTFKPSEHNPGKYHVECCSGCGEVTDSVNPGAHTYAVKYDANHHWEVCTVCEYATAKESHVYSDASDTSCNDCDYVRHIHSYSTATCTTPATCSCGATTGGKDPSNHTGGTEIRNAVEATRTEKGYTGDTYCLGCGSMIASGEEIPTKGYVAVRIDDDTDVLEVTFTTVEGVTLPDDAEVIVEDHTATIEPIAGLVGEDANTEYVSLDDKDIEITEPLTFTYDGVTYHIDEVVEIDGTEYIVSSITTSVSLMRLTDGVVFEFNRYSGAMQKFSTGTYKKMSSKLSINGVTYDVVAAFNPYEISEDKLDTDRLTYWVLYYEGKPVGRYFPNQGYATFKENYDPATLKSQKDNIFLGTVTTGETPIDGLESGKTYNTYVVGANEISMKNATAVSGTVTQTFEIPAEFVGNENVKYVAVHDPNPYAKALAEAEATRFTSSHNEMEYIKLKALYDSWAEANKGIEYGTVTVAADGKTVIATYEVDSFSPFIVYAFVEADEPEIKTLSATIVDGSDDTTEAPDTSEPVVSPQTSDNTVWYILIAVVAGAIVVVSVVYGKRRKNKAN